MKNPPFHRGKSTVSARLRRANEGNKEVKKRGGGFTKPCNLSPQLQKLVGASELARTEVISEVC